MQNQISAKAGAAPAHNCYKPAATKNVKGKGKLYIGPIEFCSFEMDILQESFFDGRK